MSPEVLLGLLALTGSVMAKRRFSKRGENCPKIDTVTRTLNDDYCDQPLFATFLPKTEENQLLDNVCFTYFPLPDDPNTLQVYSSRVFCDGSSDVISYIATDIERGVVRLANPYCTHTELYFGYAGCDTNLVYRCHNFGDCGDGCDPYIYGLSANCHTIGLSCLSKVEEIIIENNLPDVDFYVLPMKLPNRCVTQKNCINTPNHEFYKSIGMTGPIHRYKYV